MSKSLSPKELHAIVDAITVGRKLYDPKDASRSSISLDEIRFAREQVEKLLRVDSGTASPETETAAVISIWEGSRISTEAKSTHRPNLGNEKHGKPNSSRGLVSRAAAIAAALIGAGAIALLALSHYVDLRSLIATEITPDSKYSAGLRAQVYGDGSPLPNGIDIPARAPYPSFMTYERIGIPRFLSSATRAERNTAAKFSVNASAWSGFKLVNELPVKDLPQSTQWPAEVVQVLQVAPPLPTKPPALIQSHSLELAARKHDLKPVKYVPAHNEWPFDK
jgi:hypothetical protein